MKVFLFCDLDLKEKLVNKREILFKIKYISKYPFIL